MKTKSFLILLNLLLLLAGTRFSHAMNTKFSYSGFLKDAGVPANGSYDLKFTLHNAVTASPPLGGLVQEQLNVPVNGGMLSVVLDFGGAHYTGQTLWLEMSVRKSGTPNYLVQSPRQEIRPVPYALFAEKSGGLSGNPTLTGTTTFAPPSGAPFQVSGNNTATVNNLSADKLDGMDSSAFWQLGGNANTTPGTHYLGTTDNHPLELKVNGKRVLRLEPAPPPAPNVIGWSATSPNMIGGQADNKVNNGVIGATIAGGGASSRSTGLTTFPAEPNQVRTNYGTISGGRDNLVDTGGLYATIPGGYSAKADKHGQMAYASGNFASPGDAQSSLYVLRRQTTDGAQAELFLDGAGKRMVVPYGGTWAFEILVVARATNGLSAGYRFSGVIENNQGAIKLVGTPSKSILGEESTGWDVTVAALGYVGLVIRVQGGAITCVDEAVVSVPINWVATVRTVETVAADGVEVFCGLK